jgi:hypothetical protein
MSLFFRRAIRVKLYHHHHHQFEAIPNFLPPPPPPTNTRREPSAFEVPSSSAPPVLNRLTERLYIVNPGLSRLQNGHQDAYEPGTQGERRYMRGLSSIWQTDIVDAATATAELIEREVIEGVIEVDDNTIEVETNRSITEC